MTASFAPYQLPGDTEAQKSYAFCETERGALAADDIACEPKFIEQPSNVRFWHKADTDAVTNVCFRG